MNCLSVGCHDCEEDKVGRAAVERASMLIDKLSSIQWKLESRVKKDADVVLANLIKKIGGMSDAQEMINYLIDVATKLEKMKVEKLGREEEAEEGEDDGIEFVKLMDTSAGSSYETETEAEENM